MKYQIIAGITSVRSQINFRKCSISKLLIKIVVAIASEIILTSLGLDDLADYSEFTLEYKGVGTPNCVASIL